MIKVLQVIGSLDYGGIESVIMNYYRHINREKVRFDFITTSKGGRFEDEIRELGGGIFYLPSKSRHPFRYMKQLKKIIKDNNYDIVHSNTNSASAYLDLRPAKKAKCRIRIAHSHNSNCLVKWQHRIFRPLLPTVVTYRCACSDEAAKWLFGKNKDYTLINNGIDFDKFAFKEASRNKVREVFSWQDSFVIGNVASFQGRKNQRYLIELMPRLVKEIPNVRLVLVGDGSTRHELQMLADSTGMSDKIEFLGNRNDVNELLNGFDMFCFPSIFEGLAVAYIEAVCNGLPVLISDGVPTIGFAKNVYQMPLKNELWVDKISAISKAQNSRHEMTQRELIDMGYDIEHLAAELCSLYEKLANADKELQR